MYRVGWFIVGLLNAKLPLGRHCYMTRLRSQEVGGGGTTPNATVTVTTRINFCIKMVSGVSHFHVLLIARGKVTRQRSQTTAFQGKGELKQGTVPVSSTLPPGPASPLGYRVFSKKGFTQWNPPEGILSKKKRSNLKLKIKDFFFKCSLDFVFKF